MLRPTVEEDMSAVGIVLGGALVVSRRRPVLSVHKVFAGVPELLTQLVHNLLEDDRVHVLTEHVKEEPVAHLGLADDRVDHFAVDEPEADVEQVGPHPRAQDDDEPVQEDQGRQEAQDEEPEPEEDVNLFVDDVERQDAEGVVLLHLARRAELVESALGHPREDVDHRVDPLLLVAFREGDHVKAERQERPVEERVHQKHLTYFHPLENMKKKQNKKEEKKTNHVSNQWQSFSYRQGTPTGHTTRAIHSTHTKVLNGNQT